MDVSEQLPPELLAVLSDAEVSLAETDVRFQETRTVAHAQLHAAQPELEIVFSDSLKLKSALDQLEARSRSDPAPPKPADLALVLNCEYQLHSLNSATPIRYNPFLSHWVEAIQRWEKDPWPRAPKAPHQGALQPLAWWHIQTARVSLIKHILRGAGKLERSNPIQIVQMSISGTPEPFDVSQYVEILEEEGIYERSQSVPTADGAISTAERTERFKPPVGARGTQSPADFKSMVMSRLQAEPNSSHHVLTHLPIDLSSLDLITTMIQEGTFKSFQLDPVSLVRDYIQHSLRTIERMGQSQPAAGHETVQSAFLEDTSTNPGGRDEQTRAVKLMVLFLNNMVRKALLPPEELYFEVQEICVRYIWIREVRDFKSFVEGAG